MITKLFAIFYFISELATLLRKVLNGVIEIYGLQKQAKLQGWEEDLNAVTKAIKEAKDDEARKELVKKLADLSRNLPS